ncbi:hypothetical protein ElyMa_004988600 [Elysia marginata]|uniref:Uncharacterized protein n=1 Tax=Elysia marginata TaxID=1093978 RepID=A0AAV4J5W6_9GAST|nr:hypothetical protein ElyMa_004988600 [Elysia marginata]
MTEMWKTKHHHHSRQDGWHWMDRQSHATLFRLRTGYNRLKTHMSETYKIGRTDLCSYGEAAETTENILQVWSSPMYLRQNPGDPLKS